MLITGICLALQSHAHTLIEYTNKKHSSWLTRLIYLLTDQGKSIRKDRIEQHSTRRDYRLKQDNFRAYIIQEQIGNFAGIIIVPAKPSSEVLSNTTTYMYPGNDITGKTLGELERQAHEKVSKAYAKERLAATEITDV